MTRIIRMLFGRSRQSAYRKDLLRLAQCEYKKDWEYAYYAMLDGRNPK